MTDKENKLTTRQENFCLAYVRLGNATQAYKEAGYTTKSEACMASNSWRMLRNEKVKARIEELQAKIRSDKMMDIAERRERLAEIARDSDSTKQDVIRAIDTLNKMDGAYLQRTEITGNGIPVVICDDITETSKRKEA